MLEKSYNIDIELTILSSIIYDPALLDKYKSRIKNKLFYLNSHKKIIEMILQLHKDEKIIDEIILHNKLGNSYDENLLSILSKNPINKLDDYLNILQDFSIKRDVASLANDINKNLETDYTGIELQAKINNLTDNLNKTNELEIFEIKNIEDIEDKNVEFICKEWLPIPLKTVSLITAPGGVGKSWLVQQLAIRAIMEGKIKKAFLWLSEDSKEISKNRFNSIFNKVMDLSDNTIKSKIDISDSQTIQFLYDEQRKLEISPLFVHFKVKLQEYDLIILDPLIAFYGSDENNNSSARRFMQLFTDWANKENKTIIFIHHSTKNTTQSRGASAFVDAVRTVYEIERIKNVNGEFTDTNKRNIKLTKDNYGVGYLLQNSVFQRELFPQKKETNNQIKIKPVKKKISQLYNHEDF